MVPSHRRVDEADAHPALNPLTTKAPRFARAGALFPGDRIFGRFLLATLGDIKDKVTAGLNPADPATLGMVGGPGPAPAINLSDVMLAGIDLGGTQVRVALARSDGNLIASVKTKTPLLKTPQAMVAWAAAEIERHRGREKVRSIAIGAPGPIDVKRGILVNPPNLPGWRNVPLAALLRKATGAKVHLANDADMAGLGEFHRGAGRGTRNMVYITWSTGVGGGLIIDGKLHRGAHGTAGEVGHMIIDPNGPLDQCGQRGCLEVFCGGANLARETGHPAAELFAAAARGDKQAGMVVERAARYMGMALISLTNAIDPEMFVMGGGVTHSWALVQPLMVETLRSSPFIKPARRPRLRRARLGDRAGQVGAVEWARINQ